MKFASEISQVNKCAKDAKYIEKYPNMDYRMAWIGRDLKDHPIPIPLPWIGLPPARPGCSVLHTASRDAPSIAFVDSMFQCLTTFSVKNFPRTSNLF